MRVVEITAEQTHDLRRRVLRADSEQADVVWLDDHADGTVHLGIVDDDDGNVIAISTWLAADLEDRAPGSAVQLRGMASDPARRSTGLGTMLLDAGVDRARRAGFALIWANARVTAVGFYERYGFVVTGPEFVTPATGLPHRLVVLTLE